MLKIDKMWINLDQVTIARYGEEGWFLRFGSEDEHDRQAEASLGDPLGFEQTLVGANFYRLYPEDRELNAERVKEIYFNPSRVLQSKVRPDGNFTIVFPFASISLTPSSYAALAKRWDR